MANLATIAIIGRMGRDAETKYTNAGKMTVVFTLAVNRRRGETESTAWYRCTAFGRLAETLDKLAQSGALVKGREVYVSGDFDPREYTANDGTQRVSYDVFCDKVQLIGARDETAPPQGIEASDVPF